MNPLIRQQPSAGDMAKYKAAQHCTRSYRRVNLIRHALAFQTPAFTRGLALIKCRTLLPVVYILLHHTLKLELAKCRFFPAKGKFHGLGLGSTLK